VINEIASVDHTDKQTTNKTTGQQTTERRVIEDKMLRFFVTFVFFVSSW